MFHEPFLGQLPCSIDLFYFAAWLRDRGNRCTDRHQGPAGEQQDRAPDSQRPGADAKERLLLESAAPDFPMF